MIRMVLLVLACVVAGGCRDSSSPVGTWKPSIEAIMAKAGVSMPPGMEEAMEDVKDDFGSVALKLHANHTFTLQSESGDASAVQNSSTIEGRWEQVGEQVFLKMDAPKGTSDTPRTRSRPFMEFRFVEGKLISQSAKDGPGMVFVRS